MTVHPFQLIQINGKKSEIDIDMIPLIRELNRMGLETVECCQGENLTEDFFSEKIVLRYFSLKLGKNMGFKVEPLGNCGEQRLVIYWKN